MAIVVLRNSVRGGIEICRWNLAALIDQRWALSLNVCRFQSKKHNRTGYSVAWILSDNLSKARWRRSLLDSGFLENCRAVALNLTGRDAYVDAFLEATENGHVFSPYTLCESEVTSESGLNIEIGGCRIAVAESLETASIRISERELEVEILGEAKFSKVFQSRFQQSESVFLNSFENPWYRCTATISLDSLKRQYFSGDLWVDRQELEGISRSAILKGLFFDWSLFSIRLTGHKVMRIFQASNRPGEIQGSIFSTDGETRKLVSMEVSEHSKYESLRTYNKYPGGWSIGDGKGSVMLEVIPVLDDQEVYTFSLQRGVMQYHCKISGDVDGVAVDSTANVETTGSRFDLNEFFWGQEKTSLARQLKAFIPEQVSERWLRRLCPSRQHINLDMDALQESIIAPLWSMMNRGGKGWRSTWFTLCCHALDNSIENEQIRGLLPVTELIHTGSLIIDDIQDHSSLRRGKPALHKEIGTDLAINVGNFCYFLPLCAVDELKGLDDGQRYRILSIILEALRLGHLGQAVDLMWSNSRMDIAAKLGEIEQTTDQLIEQYRSKSGCQLNAIARIAGELSRAPAELVSALADYSDSFGVVFQIIDDVIDVVDGKSVLGKEDNEDLRNFKLNFVMLKAFASLDAPTRLAWFERIQSSAEAERTKILLELIYSTNAVHAALDHAYDIYNQSLEKLDSLPATDAKLMMKSVPAWLLDQQRIKLKSGEFKLRRKN